MKLLLFIIVLILSVIPYVYSNSSSSSSYKYVKVEMYPNGNGECTGDVIQGSYFPTNVCENGLSKLVCLEDGTIEQIYHSGINCNGEISKRIPIEQNNCTNSAEYICVEEMTIPDNSLQIYTTNNACPESNPNWKSEIYEIDYMLTDTCINIQGIKYISCNSSTPVAYLYNSMDSCLNDNKNPTGYQYLEFPECSKYNPQIPYCNGTPIKFCKKYSNK